MDAQVSMTIINLAWLAFFAIVALSVLQYKIKQIKERKVRIMPLIDVLPFAIFFIVLGLWESSKLGFANFENVAAQNLGLLLLLFGLAIYVYARYLLAGCWSVSVKIAPPPHIVRRGIYKHVRHPMYTAILLMIVGSALLSANWLMVMFLPLIVEAFYIKARSEEEILCLIFKEYNYYIIQTKMFLPWIF